MIKGMCVVAVYASDFDESYRFYTEALGMKLNRQMGAGLLLDAAENLQFYLEGGRKPLERTKEAATTQSRLSVVLASLDGALAAKKRLESAGVPIVGEYGHPESSFYGFQFLDPSGNLLEIAGAP